MFKTRSQQTSHITMYVSLLAISTSLPYYLNTYLRNINCTPIFTCARDINRRRAGARRRKRRAGDDGGVTTRTTHK